MDMKKVLQYMLWRKDDDLGWYISESSFKLDDFDKKDRYYFEHMIEHEYEITRVGASRYELNWRTV